MSWTPSVYMLPSLVAGVLSALLAGYAWRHRTERAARPFVALTFGLAWWALAYGIEIGFSSVGAVFFVDKVAFVGSVTVPAAMFLLGIEYAGFDESLPPWTPVVLAVEPAITLVLVWTYPVSHLVWVDVGIRHAAGLSFPVIDFGWWYWANFLYSYALIVTALALIGYVFVRGQRLYRRQSALLLVGAIVPLGANLLYNLFPVDSPVPGIDLTTFALAITVGCYAAVLFRFRMLDYAPSLQSMLLQEIGDGFVIVDDRGDVREANDVGRRAIESFAPESVDTERLESYDGHVIDVGAGDADRIYEVRTAPVTDFRDQRVGSLVVLRDITELQVLRDNEQRLSVLNRLLRHNIRNEMTVVMGYGELLAESTDGDDRRFAETIVERGAKMASIAEKARYLNGAGSMDAVRSTVDVGPIVDGVVGRARERFTDATVDRSGDRAARARVVSPADVETAVAYLVENAVEHNDTGDPHVDVSLRRGDDEVVVSVVDDGPGIPADERAVLESGAETPLHHGSGLGLWIVAWLVGRSDGELGFRENDPRGSVVTIRWRAASNG